MHYWLYRLNILFCRGWKWLMCYGCTLRHPSSCKDNIVFHTTARRHFHTHWSHCALSDGDFCWMLWTYIKRGLLDVCAWFFALFIPIPPLKDMKYPPIPFAKLEVGQLLGWSHIRDGDGVVACCGQEKWRYDCRWQMPLEYSMFFHVVGKIYCIQMVFQEHVSYFAWKIMK